MAYVRPRRERAFSNAPHPARVRRCAAGNAGHPHRPARHAAAGLPSIPEALVLDACRQLLRERPAGRLRLHRRLARELTDSLQAGELDLVVAPCPASMPMPSPPHCCSTTAAVLADPAHPLHGRGPLRLADWRSRNGCCRSPTSCCASRSTPPSASAAWASRSCASKSISAVPRCSSWSPAHPLTIAGTRDGAAHGGLRALPLRQGELDLGAASARSRGSGAYLSPLAQRMIELLREGRRAQARLKG